jgi:nucleotide-binding universal stress UspA family protein
MSYKTILVHADLSVHAPDRIRFAAALANAEGAHLVGAAMTGITRFLETDSGLDLEHSVVTGYLDRLRAQARLALEQFDALAREAGARSFEPRLIEDDPEGALVLQSRFADLVVLSQTDPASPAPGAARDLPEYVVLHAPRPVLLVPYAGQPCRVDGKVLAAWDGGLAAARALASAIPLLRHARDILVAQFNSGKTDEPDDVQGESADLFDWLGRHGIRSRVDTQHNMIGNGGALLSLAAEQQADLLVMGAYGHTRFRELLLGGVTRTVLQETTLPVLLQH